MICASYLIQAITTYLGCKSHTVSLKIARDEDASHMRFVKVTDTTATVALPLASAISSIRASSHTAKVERQLS